MEEALKNAGDVGQAKGALMYALTNAALTHIHPLCRDFATARTLADRRRFGRSEKEELYWKGYEMMLQGCVLALTAKPPTPSK